MATTNLLQWNPTAANQETDTTYAADSQRSGGATDPSMFLAPLANKLFYQVSTYLTALFTAFAAKGYATSDASVSVLAAQCANFLTTADVKPPMIQVPYSATPTFDLTQSTGFQIVLTGNITNITFAGLTTNQSVLLAFTQDSVGGHTVTFPSVVQSPGTPSTTPNSANVQQFIVLVSGNLHPVGPMVVS